MPDHRTEAPSSDALPLVLRSFEQWLDRYGETSWDHQSFFAGAFGRGAKRLYYRNKFLGTAAVAPMIFCEAALPSARRMFHQRTRFPIADAHYAMGFAYLYEVGRDPAHLARAAHFLDELKRSRSPGFPDFAWGYPFDWVTRNGTLAAQTPLITTTPYVYEAFMQVHALDGRPEWREIAASIARHARRDFKDFPVSAAASACSYTPHDSGGVINAAAYRSYLLTRAADEQSEPEYRSAAARNLAFVLENQNADGSWPYAVDGVRDFVDHFHTCFVMKALAKIHDRTGDAATLSALRRGVAYYLGALFDGEGLPKPFAKAPRLTVYRRELYDCAECINLCLLLRGRFPELGPTLERVVRHIVEVWVRPDGSFRARKLKYGWDNVPMHRWAQSQMFRALSFYQAQAASAPTPH